MSIPRLLMMAKDGEVAFLFQPLWGLSRYFMRSHGGQVADPMIEAHIFMTFLRSYK